MGAAAAAASHQRHCTNSPTQYRLPLLISYTERQIYNYLGGK